MLKIKAKSIGSMVDIRGVATESIRLANRLTAAVELELGGVPLVVFPWHEVDEVVGQYEAADCQPTTEKERWVVWEEPRQGLSEGGIPVTVSVKVRCTEGEAAQMQRRVRGAHIATEAELVVDFMIWAGAWYEVGR